MEYLRDHLHSLAGHLARQASEICRNRAPIETDKNLIAHLRADGATLFTTEQIDFGPARTFNININIEMGASLPDSWIGVVASSVRSLAAWPELAARPAKPSSASRNAGCRPSGGIFSKLPRWLLPPGRLLFLNPLYLYALGLSSGRQLMDFECAPTVCSRDGPPSAARPSSRPERKGDLFKFKFSQIDIIITVNFFQKVD